MTRPFNAGLMKSLLLSTTKRDTSRVMTTAMTSSLKESQRVPEWNSKNWLELMSFRVLKLERDKEKTRVDVDMMTRSIERGEKYNTAD